MCLWMFSSLHSLKLLSPKHSSFVCGLNGHRAQLPTPSVRHPHCIGLCTLSYRRKPTAARRLPGKKRLRRNAAAPCGVLRPRRGCGVAAEQRRRGGRQGERWPGPQSAKRAPDIESRTWGVSILFFLEILRNMFAFSVNPKHAKNIEKCWDQWSHVRSDSRGLKGGSRARNRASPTWGTSRIFLGWKFCVAALLAENWWSSYSLFDFLDDIAFERLFDLWTKTIL